jgi:hypothetical protein
LKTIEPRWRDPRARDQRLRAILENLLGGVYGGLFRGSALRFTSFEKFTDGFKVIG